MQLIDQSQESLLYAYIKGEIERSSPGNPDEEKLAVKYLMQLVDPEFEKDQITVDEKNEKPALAYIHSLIKPILDQPRKYPAFAQHDETIGRYFIRKNILLCLCDYYSKSNNLPEELTQEWLIKSGNKLLLKNIDKYKSSLLNFVLNRYNLLTNGELDKKKFFLLLQNREAVTFPGIIKYFLKTIIIAVSLALFTWLTISLFSPQSISLYIFFAPTLGLSAFVFRAYNFVSVLGNGIDGSHLCKALLGNPDEQVASVDDFFKKHQDTVANKFEAEKKNFKEAIINKLGIEQPSYTQILAAISNSPDFLVYDKAETPPNESQDQKLEDSTGLHRRHMINIESSSDSEELEDSDTDSKSL